MEHGQRIRIVPGADMAILFIHGILGTPNHFTPLLPFVPSNWSICNLLLKGHGGSVTDLSAASMGEWKRQVHKALQSLLESHSHVVITAHSMGTLFAIQEALVAPVAELFLLNAPLYIHITPQLFRTAWKIFRGNIKPDDAWTLAAQRAYGIGRDEHVLHYLGWIPRYLELFSEIRSTRKMVRHVAVKSQAYFSLRDEMVSPRSGAALKSPDIAVKYLSTSGHFYYSPQDQQLIQMDFCDMIQRVSNQK